ncbi:MAG: hypothetical protein ACXWT3_05295 [Methylococcaceae bacterium]
MRIEEAVFDAPGVKRLNTEISQGLCQVRVAVLPDYDKEQVMSALRMRVQALSRLPKALEKIDVQPAMRDDDDGVMWVALHGPTDALTLKRFGEQILQQLAAIPASSRRVIMVKSLMKSPLKFHPSSYSNIGCRYTI